MTMDPNLSDLRLLETFQVLMAERSVSRAAARMNLSQPAMSHALARLRALFDDPLLIKRSGLMVPSQRGLDLQQEVADLLARAQRLVAAPSAFSPRTAKLHFKIMSPEFAGALIAPPLLARLAQDAPGIVLTFQAADPTRALEYLEAGEFDCRLGWWPAPAPGLKHKILFSDRIVAIVRKDHAYDRAGLTKEQYLDARHVRVQPPGLSYSMRSIDQAAARVGRKLSIAALVQNAIIMMEAIEQSDLIGSMTERMARRMAHNFAVRILPMPLSVPELKVALYWHERTQRQPALRWLRETIADVGKAIV